MSLSRTLIPVAFVAFLVFATACSGNDGNGAWKGKTESGTDLTVDLWVPATDPGVAPFEAFRKATGAPEVLYGKVTAKNNGNAPDNGRFITLTGKDGNALGDDAIEANFVCGQISRWLAVALTQSAELNIQLASLQQGACKGTTVGPTIAPGETAVYYVALEAESEPEFERAFAGAPNELKR